MEIALLGTGCSSVETERYGPAQVVRHGGHAVLVDCGSGLTRRLLGRRAGDARAVWPARQERAG